MNRSLNDLPITERVIAWNAARYDQVFDFDLTVKLLLEETQELYAAKTDIEKLDAIGDIVFVAIGALWKLGLEPKSVFEIFYQQQIDLMSMDEAHAWTLSIQAWAFDNVEHISEKHGAWPGLTLILFSTFVTALGALHGMGMQDKFYDVVYAICNSNDTKEVKGKTDPTVKANINKGADYVGPQVELARIIEQHQAERRMAH